MPDNIPPTALALREALDLSGELLRHLELSDQSLTSSALMAARVARLLNDFEFQRIFQFEAGGYPTTPSGMTPDSWKLAGVAGRQYQANETDKASKREVLKSYAYIESIAQLEEQVRSGEQGIAAARDPDVSIASANPHQYVSRPIGNTFERRQLRESMSKATMRLASRRSFIYAYVLGKHYELKFSGIASDAFSRIRARLDTQIGAALPESIRRFTAVYENLLSDNPEDWANAVHSCRRILQDLADVLFPATDQPRVTSSGKTISLGPDNYINRLVCFVEDSSSAGRFTDLVGSHLSLLGDRLDAVFRATQKGSHSEITDKAEADRYVVFTYLLVGDLVSLRAGSSAP